MDLKWFTGAEKSEKREMTEDSKALTQKAPRENVVSAVRHMFRMYLIFKWDKLHLNELTISRKCAARLEDCDGERGRDGSDLWPVFFVLALRHSYPTLLCQCAKIEWLPSSSLFYPERLGTSSTSHLLTDPLSKYPPQKWIKVSSKEGERDLSIGQMHWDSGGSS